MIRAYPHHRGLPVDELLFNHVQRAFERRVSGALGVPGLEQVEPPLLDGEFHVLHVPEVAFQRVFYGNQFVKDRFVGLFQGADLLRGPYARHHVLALGIHQVFTVEFLEARGGVPAEADAGAGIFPVVAEDHGLNVHCRAPDVLDLVELSVFDGPLVHPGAEDRADGSPELLLGVLGEFLSGMLEDDPLVVFRQPFQVLLM